VEPVKLSWDGSSKCFYSAEVKIPVGTYIGNLVVDGTFYPVEDVSVKHYTFEVDLYLKDGKRLYTILVFAVVVVVVVVFFSLVVCFYVDNYCCCCC